MKLLSDRVTLKRDIGLWTGSALIIGSIIGESLLTGSLIVCVRCSEKILFKLQQSGKNLVKILI